MEKNVNTCYNKRNLLIRAIRYGRVQVYEGTDN